jgi:hypothetical protein
MHKPLEVVPRAVVTRYINAPVGPPKNAAIHHEVMAMVLNLLQQTEHRVATIAGRL